MQFGRDSSVQQINLSSSNNSISSSSSSKDIVSNAILSSNSNNNEEQPSSPTRRTNTNIKNNKRPNKIILLGERHSGTNWITNYLKDCFIGNSTNSDITVREQYKRFKHWFQQDDLSIVEEDSAVVVSMFRDPMVR